MSSRQTDVGTDRIGKREEIREEIIDRLVASANSPYPGPLSESTLFVSLSVAGTGDADLVRDVLAELGDAGLVVEQNDRYWLAQPPR